MHTIFIHGDDYVDAHDLHAAIKRLLRLPEHYGHNADALYDCLSSRHEKVNLTVLNTGNSDVEAALRICAAVIHDLGGTVTGL